MELHQTCPEFRPAIRASQDRLLEAAGVKHESRLLNLRLGCKANVVVCSTNPNAPVLVLLHGWGAGLGTFAFALPYLASHFSVYCIDLPGMGGSDRCPFPNELKNEPQASIDFFLSHLDSTFEALAETDDRFQNARERILCAHSMGAYLSVLWMLKDSASPKFASLILLSPVGVPERPLPENGNRLPFIFRIARQLWAGGFTPQLLLRKVPRIVAKRMTDRYTMARFGSLGDAEKIAALSSYLLEISLAPGSSELAFLTILEPGAWARRPLLNLLPKIDCKVTFVYGRQDWMDVAPAKSVADVMGAKVEIIPGEHNIHISNFAGFADVVIQHHACTDR